MDKKDSSKQPFYSQIGKDLREWLNSTPGYREQIRMLREAAGMTQEQLAKKVNRTPRSIRTIENGEAFPRITTLQEIAKALNAELSILLIPKSAVTKIPEKLIEAEEKALPEIEDIDSDSQAQDNDYDASDIKIGETD